MTTANGPWKLNQAADIRNFLKEHKMEASRVCDRPGDPDLKHEKAITGASINQGLYQSTIGSLLWFAITTRPDIIYVVNIVVQFQQNPTSLAWNVTKCIMRYLNKTSDISLVINPVDT